jgi:hypothetical protein
MGLFSFLKSKSMVASVVTMTEEYKKMQKVGMHPKASLCFAFDKAKPLSEQLSSLEADRYFTMVFGDEYTNLSDDPWVARPFVEKAVCNVISAYVHPVPFFGKERDELDFLIKSELSK